MTVKARTFLTAVLVATAPSTVLAGGDNGFGYAAPQPIGILSTYDLVRDAFASTTALYLALNGDLAREGLAVRLAVTTDSYSYDYRWLPGDVDGDAWAVDGMLGYRWVRGDVTSAIFVGAEHQDHDLSPKDPFNPVRGSETGFKVLVEFTKLPTPHSPLYTDLTASYSTAFDTYHVDGRLGWAFGQFVVGPEVWFMGDEADDAQRVGGFLMTDLPPLLFKNFSSQLTLSVGYQFSDNDNGPSTFGAQGIYGAARFNTKIAWDWR
ncbi:MAG: hypothetical protein DIU63_05965 [Proteobacteria bacterium]|jgi:hypothetical protein|nr:MAG: hypothetical protein DIU63_05965 [Pseudomonadota bacterium]